MEPLFIYRSDDRFLVRSLTGKHDHPPDDYNLVASIDPRAWLQCFLNYGPKDRARMLRDITGE